MLVSKARVHPERLRGCFTARMGELNADQGALGMREVDDALERFDLTVLPQSLEIGLLRLCRGGT